MSAPLRFGVFITPFHPIGQSPTVALEYDMERVVALDRHRLHIWLPGGTQTCDEPASLGCCGVGAVRRVYAACRA